MAGSPEFDRFLNDLENLYTKIKYENPYAMFFTGDFNSHSQNWWPEENTNNEGIAIVKTYHQHLTLTKLYVNQQILKKNKIRLALILYSVTNLI